MDPTGAVVPIPKAKEPINILTGIFLKSVYFLDPEGTKCVITGIFKNRDNSLGILIKGRRGWVFWSYDTFCQLFDQFNEVSLALYSKHNCLINTDPDSGDKIKVACIFGSHYAYLTDGEHTLSLSVNEWNKFISNLHLVNRDLLELFYQEELIKDFIDNIIIRNILVNRFELLPPHIVERLNREVFLYLDGGGS